MSETTESIQAKLRGCYMDTKQMIPCELQHQAADVIDSLQKQIADLTRKLELAREALENVEGMLDELRDYPVTHDMVIEALSAIKEK